MSLLSALNIDGFFLLSSLAVALAGGLHCAGMCGAFAALAHRPTTMAYYQLGRLFSYALLGLLAGSFGASILHWIPEDQKIWVSVGLALTSVWILLSSWNLDFPGRLQKYLWKNRPQGSEKINFLTLGLMNGILPCHWLYGFLGVAAGFGSPAKGLILLVALWAGSLPWLLASSSISRALRHWSRGSQWIARALFLIISLGLIAHGFLPKDPHTGCHISSDLQKNLSSLRRDSSP